MTFAVPAAVTLTAVGVASELTRHPATTIETAAGILVALGVIWRYTRVGTIFRTFRALAELAPAVTAFLLDWKGQPARDGVAAIPSFPVRMQRLESLAQDLARDLARIEAAASGNADALGRVENRASVIEQRQTDHRRRNDETIEHLRRDIETRLANISEDLLRAETMRAALAELGIPFGRPDHQDPT